MVQRWRSWWDRVRNRVVGWLTGHDIPKCPECSRHKAQLIGEEFIRSWVEMDYTTQPQLLRLGGPIRIAVPPIKVPVRRRLVKARYRCEQCGHEWSIEDNQRMS